MLITDAQVHLWDRETPDRPWIDGGRDFAHGDEYGVDRLLVEMKSAAVDRVVLVPPSFEGDRNEVCLAAARAYPDTFAVMGRIPLDDPNGPERVATWRDEPGMLGIRLTFSKGPAQTWLEEGKADWLWPAAEAAGVPIMMSVPGKTALVGSIAERHPQLKLVVDHFGLKIGQYDDELDEPLAVLAGLARHDNVAVKATCLPRYSRESFPFPSMHERVHRMVDAFSPRRIFWGSDLSGLPCSYDEVKRLFVDEMDFLSDDDLDWIMGRGIHEWLGWSR